jgi:hypothetical protein
MVGLISKKAFDYLKSGIGLSKTRNFGKTSRGNGVSEKSETQHFSNISLESLKIRVKPVPRQHSIESSAEKYFAKDHNESQFVKNDSKESISGKFPYEKGELRKSGVFGGSRQSYPESKLNGPHGQLDLNCVREQMEKYPVLKMDIVTSLEKRMTSKVLNQKG